MELQCRYPKFIWAPCAYLYSLAEVPHPPPAFGLIHCYKNWWKITSAPSGGADQTIRVTENNLYICDGHIWFFPTFPMLIFNCFEVFRLCFLFKGWKSPTFRSFPIMFPFQKMEIPDFSEFSTYVSFSKDGNPQHLRWTYLVFSDISDGDAWKTLNTTAHTGLDPATSLMLTKYSTTEPHIYLKVG
jgi:hypothetical protein